MKWSWRIGKISGIDVYIHATFLILLAWVGWQYWAESHDVVATLVGVAFMATIFGCVLLHEFGHALAARRFGIATRDITLLPIGGLARLERMPDKPLQELWVAIAGPLVNVAIAAGLTLFLLATGGWGSGDLLDVAGGSFLHRLIFVNLVLVIFNLIPAFPMDGGRVLRAILALSLNYTMATQIAATIGQALALLFGLAGILILQNPMLLFIALFVWIGAGQEASMVLMKSALSGIPASQAMLTDFRAIPPDADVKAVLQLVMAGSQTDFPVVQDSRIVGILTRADLLSSLATRGPQTPVTDIMQRQFKTVDPGEMLEVAFARLQECACHTLPVVRNGQLIGLITADNVGEFLMIQAALASSHKR
jgi:Zn-dependent protease